MRFSVSDMVSPSYFVVIAAAPHYRRIAGNPQVQLFVSADTVDADWVVKLIDVHPDGRAFNLATGLQRARYRKSLQQPELLQPNEICELTIDLGPCAASIAAGHRLQIDICGSLFPLFDRNPNTAAGIFGHQTAVSNEQVHHSPETLSRLILPVIPPTQR